MATSVADILPSHAEGREDILIETVVTHSLRHRLEMVATDEGNDGGRLSLEKAEVVMGNSTSGKPT